MTNNAGVWIDHKHAIVVLVTDSGQEVKKITSDIDTLGRPTRATRSKHKYTPNDFVAEDILERKIVNQRNRYYDEVIARLRGAKAILILGPGEAKGEFSKRIESKKLRGRILELETTDKMTDRQIAAKVGAHFASTTANKSMALKKSARSNAPNVASKQRTKKARR